ATLGPYHAPATVAFLYRSAISSHLFTFNPSAFFAKRFYTGNSVGVSAREDAARAKLRDGVSLHTALRQPHAKYFRWCDRFVDIQPPPCSRKCADFQDLGPASAKSALTPGMPARMESPARSKRTHRRRSGPAYQLRGSAFAKRPRRGRARGFLRCARAHH